MPVDLEPNRLMNDQVVSVVACAFLCKGEDISLSARYAMIGRKKVPVRENVGKETHSGLRLPFHLL